MLCVSLLKKSMYKWTESRGKKTEIKVFLVQNMWNVVEKKTGKYTMDNIQKSSFWFFILILLAKTCEICGLYTHLCTLICVCMWASQVALVVKNPLANAGRRRGCIFHPWVKKIPWRREWQPTPVFLPGESHGQRSLAGCSPWGRTESDTAQVT